MRILLIGPRACGKTTIGRRLAARLAVPFTDLDEVTRASFDEPTVEAIWAAHGEAGWRRAEADALASTLAGRSRVIALGGGTPMVEAARDLIQRERADGRCVVVYLRCDPAELERRLRAETGDRPSLTGAEPAAEIAAVLATREPTYRAIADWRRDVTTETADAVVQAIAGWVAGLEEGGRGGRHAGGAGAATP